MNLQRIMLAAAIAIGSSTSPAGAAPIVYFGIDNATIPIPHPVSDAARKAFVDELGIASISTQDFETVALGDFPTAIGSPFANGVGVTFTNSATDHLRITEGFGGLDTYPVSGKRFLEGLSDQGSTYFTAVFDQTVRGIGFYVTDVSDWICCGGQTIGKLKVVLTNAGGTTEFDLTPGFEPTDLRDANVMFFGVIDEADPFTSIAIRSETNIPGADSIGIDDVMISTRAVESVSEPGTLALLVGVLPVLFRRHFTTEA